MKDIVVDGSRLLIGPGLKTTWLYDGSWRKVTRFDCQEFPNRVLVGTVVDFLALKRIRSNALTTVKIGGFEIRTLKFDIKQGVLWTQQEFCGEAKYAMFYTSPFQTSWIHPAGDFEMALRSIKIQQPHVVGILVEATNVFSPLNVRGKNGGNPLVPKYWERSASASNGDWHRKI